MNGNKSLQPQGMKRNEIISNNQCLVCPYICGHTVYYITSLVFLLLSSHQAKIRQLMLLCPVLMLSWEKLTTEASHTCPSLQSEFKRRPCTWIAMTPSRISMHALSLLVCIQIPGRPFSLLAPLNYISLSPPCLNGKTECATNCLYLE